MSLLLMLDADTVLSDFPHVSGKRLTVVAKAILIPTRIHP